MEDIAGILLLVFVVLLLPWLLWLRSRHLQKKAQQQFDSRWNELGRRLSSVEAALDSLRSSTSSPLPPVLPVVDEAPSTASAAKYDDLTSSAGAPEMSASVSEQISTQEYRQGTEDLTEGVSSQAPPPMPSIPGVRVQRTPTWFARLRGGFDIEEALGTNWLNKIGVVILVLGIAFFLAYQLRELGPAGKVLVGFLVSSVLLGGGIFLERKPGYSLLARAGVGGGWALGFFTTYAMYHVEATRVLSSQGIDLLFMGAVAAGMVIHSLKYRSQAVTGIAFLLAFSTVTISHVTVYSLFAGVVLSLALVVIVLRMRWYELEVLGLLAAYLNHFYWLWHIIEPMHGHKRAFAEFVPSAVILLLYWLIFRASYIFRKIENRTQELIATTAALLNTFGMLGLFKYQSLHPEWAFWALLALGTAELGMALFARTRRRLAFVVLTTVAVTLLFASVPFRFSGMNVSMLWVAATEALLLVGIATREQVFRRLAFAASLASAIQMLSVDSARIIGIRLDDAMPGRIVPLGFALVFAAAIYYANAVYVSRRWSSLFDEIDLRVLRFISYVDVFLIAAGLWIALPGTEASPAWAFAAIVLGLVSLRTASPDLKIQADVLAVAAFIRALSINLESTAHWGHVSQRLVTVTLCAAALYLGSRLKSSTPWSERLRVPVLYTWIGSTLIGLLAWYELHTVSVAPAWALFGLILIELGLTRRSLPLRIQGYIALASSVLRIFTSNLAAGGLPGGISPRLYSTVPVIAILFYVYQRLDRERESLEAPADCRFYAAELSAWTGLACFVALVRFELQPDWVVVSWAALVPVLLAVAWRFNRLLFLQQALVLTCFTAIRGALHNFYERSLAPAPFLYSRALCVSTACTLLFISLALAYKLIRKQPPAESSSKLKRALSAFMRHPEQLLFFAPFALIISLLGAEMSKGLLTVSWSVLGVITFLFALWVRERNFRYAGLGLLLLGVGKIVVVDVWSIGARDRYLTFISMGCALLIVSFLYTRFRKAIGQYL